MKGNEILRSMSEIEESYVLEAASLKSTHKKMTLIRWISLAAAFCLVVHLAFFRDNGVTPVHAVDLMEGITANSVETVDLHGGVSTITDFSVRLTQMANTPGENTMISPLSLLYAMGMTANGAKGETLAQIESAFGMTIEDLNGWLHTFAREIDGRQFRVANSIWFKDDSRFHVSRDFLQTNANYYAADLYQAAFNEDTLADINHWVSQKTDGMIPKLLERIDPDDVMYLINALCFDGVWETPYLDAQVREDLFYREDGETVMVDFMHSTESLFLKDANSTGFIKPYEGREYAFVALLPNEGISVEEYLTSLSGENLADLLAGAQAVPVNASLPKFETEYSVLMNGILEDMGIRHAFHAKEADLSSLGTSDGGNLYISQVLQKTFISVNERGTKAAASTEVTITTESAIVPAHMETVKLDRPFVYMIVHMETGTPLFMGTMMDPGA